MPERPLASRMGIAAGIMAGGVLLSRLAGYLRDAVIAYLYGATSQTDAYFAAFTLPDFLNYLLAGGSLSITFVPIFAGYVARGEEAEGWRVFSIVTLATGLLISLLVVAGELFAPRVVPILFPGFSPAQLAETVRLTRIVMPAQLFFYVGGLISAVLYAKERFTAPALAPLVYNLCIIVGGTLLAGVAGIAGFSWGVLAGAFLGPFLLPLIALGRVNPSFSFSLNIRHAGVARFFVLGLPLMIGVSLVTADEWISRYFASSLGPGTISRINNARRLMMAPIAVFGQAMGQASLPFFSRLAAQEKLEELAQTIGVSLRGVVVLTVAASAWMILLAADIIGLVYGHGRYTAADVSATSAILVCFSLGILAWGAQGIVARGFYAMSDTLTPMITGTILTLASLPLYAALVGWPKGSGGGPGLALATSAGIFVNAALLSYLLRRRLRSLPYRDVGVAFLRMLLAVTAACVATYCLLEATGVSGIARLSAGTAVWGLLTLCLARLLGVREAALATRWVQRRLGRGP